MSEPTPLCPPSFRGVISRWWATAQIGWTWRQAVVATVLAPMMAGVLLAALWLRHESAFLEEGWPDFVRLVGPMVGLKLACFTAHGLLRGYNRFVTFQDVVLIVRASVIATAAVIVWETLFHPADGLARSVVMADLVLTILVVGALRSLVRIVAERSDAMVMSPFTKTPILIAGVTDGGESLLRSIRRDTRMPYHVAGFTTQRPSQIGTMIGGVRVLGTLDQTIAIAAKLHVRQVFIPSGDLAGREVRQLVEQASEADISVKVLPSYQQILSGRVGLKPQEVSIEDLLRRDPVQLETTRLTSWLDGQTVLVTGSAGSIGSELCRQILAFKPARLIVLDRSENGQFFLERELRNLVEETELVVRIADITDSRRLTSIFREDRPTVLFHAAAYKHVPLMEENPGEALKNIVLATKTLADLANEHGVESFVMISTDKAVNPTNIMGACKRTAELYVQSLAAESSTRFVTVRFGNVLDSAGSVVPIFRDQIRRGGPVTVTHPDVVRYFMTIPEASQLVLQAGLMGDGGEIFVLDMGEPVRIVRLAEDMIRLSGLKVGEDVEINFCGLRPGEKLYEELLVEGEENRPTPHPKILRAVCATPPEDVADQINSLRFLSESSWHEIVSQLRTIVPQFRPEQAHAIRSTDPASGQEPVPVVHDRRAA